MHHLKSFFAVLTLVALLGLPVSAVAQDSTPMAGACLAPELATPAAATPDVGSSEATAPVSEGPASRNIAAIGQSARDNIINCLNEGNYSAVAVLTTPSLWAFVGASTADEFVAFLGDTQPGNVYKEVDAVIDTNGRIGIGQVLEGISNGPGVLAAERWYFVKDGDTYKLDEIKAILAPDDLIEGIQIVPVMAVDYAFAIEQNPIPAGPTILRFTNASASGAGHEIALVVLADGVTTEEVILNDQFDDSKVTSFITGNYAEPGQTIDLVLEDLQPGTYTLICGVTTDDGVSHFHLGMVQQFTVEAAES